MKNLVLSIIFILLCATCYAQVPTPIVANGQTVCVGANHHYGDQVITPSSTYAFSITPVQAFSVVVKQINVTWTVQGVYTMTMTETTSAGCLYTTTCIITVLPPITVALDPIVVCQDGLPQTITGTNIGSNPSFSGVGVSNNTFNPSGILPGIYTINLTSTTANGCATVGTTTATINPLPTGIIYTD
jgi:hypothetical protein